MSVPYNHEARVGLTPEMRSRVSRRASGSSPVVSSSSTGEPRVADERKGDGQPLLLTAGQLLEALVLLLFSPSVFTSGRQSAGSV